MVFRWHCRAAPFVVLCVLLCGRLPARTTGGDVTSTLLIGGSKIDVTIESGEMRLSQAELLHRVPTAAEAVATYYGGHPVPPDPIHIIPLHRARGRHRRTFGYDRGLIKTGGRKQTE